ncbi:LCP family protein [Cumulibacter soli]|uniref:LCP family protein n=1 Tax=Cumulibacter soli TaxID=2546344 RepID=UPI0010683353|nr:LCP family protein [Cumulibacter soli]
MRTLCGLLSVVLLTAAAYGTVLINRVQTSAGTLEGTDDVEHNVDRVGNFDDENILIVGNDARADYTEEQLAKIGASAEISMATDTIMLIHVPADGSGASVVSLPRDSYVDIPGFWTDKINAAYAAGYTSLDDTATEEQRRAAGQNALIATVSQVSGMKIDHYVEVTLIGFYDLTEALGGIEVNLCEASYDPTRNSGADFPAGTQVLEGSKALSFVRQRYGVPGTDLGRIKRQQFFVGAVIRKVLDMDLLDLANIGKLTDIIDALAGTINYDKDLDPLKLADQMSAVATGNVTFQTIPLAEYYEQNIDGQDVVLLADQDELDAFFGSLSKVAPDEPKDDNPAGQTSDDANTDDSDAGSANAGAGDSGAGDAGAGDPSAGDAGTGNAGTGDTNGAGTSGDGSGAGNTNAGGANAGGTAAGNTGAGNANGTGASKPADDVMTAEEGSCVY